MGLLLPGKMSFAQNSAAIDSSAHRVFLVGGTIETGFVYTEDKRLEPLAHNKPFMAQIDLSMLDASKTAWDNCNCYSRTGFTIGYIDFNNAALGKSYSLSAFLEPYFYTNHKLQFSLRGAVGLAALTKVYNPTTNPDNLFYSSPVSFLLQANANLSYALSPAWRLRLSAQINHISNGGTRWPNNGINFPTAGAGLEYLIHPVRLIRREHSRPSPAIKIVAQLFAARHPTFGMSDVVSRTLAGINIGVLKPVSKLDAIGFGGEMYYDATATVYQERTGDHYDPFFASLSVQHAFYLGRVFFGQQVAYTVTPLNPNVSTRIYERYFLECRVAGGFYAGVSLKAYGGTSDHFALSTAYIW